MILMPLPQSDFDPSEAALTWKLLSEAGRAIRFATPSGQPASADPRMLSGAGLGPWKALLRARRDAREAYAQMLRDPAYRAPLAWHAVSPEALEALILPGGHAPGMRPYLESPVLQRLVAQVVAADKPLAAICHGVLLAARSARADGRSVLHGKRCTCLLRSQELTAWTLTRAWLGDYYRTYPGTTTQDEVTSHLRAAEDFLPGPAPLRRDAPGRLERGFAVTDGRLVTARWPGDAYRFGAAILELLA
ncbi:MAG TPA: type 1 glutamine amidotransferase domain-containing protein [Burkholderiales bacterium]|nr:type 1 glutamine amidotransferase domain-containing protein [Burkholderiales bacterium]